MSSKHHQVRVVVGEQEFSVEVGDLGMRPIIATIGEQRFEVTIQDTVDQQSPEIQGMAASTGKSTPMVTSPSPAPETAGSNVIIAPLPGDIIDILVKPGDRVNRGQELCSLEAMKMKNAIRAPRDGVIATVEVTRSQAVSYGEVLITLE